MSNPKKCRNKHCKQKFTPTYNTTQVVCSPKCAIAYNKQKEEEKAKKEWRKEKKILKTKLETKPELEKKFQVQINNIVRELDKGHNCISDYDKPLQGKFDAGHFFSVGSNPTIRFNLFNIFGQSVHHNQHKGGMPLEYMEGLEKTFGTQVKDFCLSLKQTESIHLSKEELREKTTIARRLVKWLKLQDKVFNTYERLELRNKLQKELGIYDLMPESLITY